MSFVSQPLSDNSTTSTNESSILTPPIHPLLDDDHSWETEEEAPSLTPPPHSFQDVTEARDNQLVSTQHTFQDFQSFHHFCNFSTHCPSQGIIWDKNKKDIAAL